MEQANSRATIINLQHLPPYQLPAGKQNLTSHLSTYLKTFIADQLRSRASSLEFPSFISLSGFFNCSYLEMYDAFRMLRVEGYDYQFSSLDGTIEVWKSQKMSPSHPKEKSR